VGTGIVRSAMIAAVAAGFFMIGAAPSGAASKTSASVQNAKVLFVVNGASGSFTPTTATPGTFNLALSGVNPDVTWFTDRPQRAAGTVTPDAALLAIGFKEQGVGPPNAVVSLRSGDPAHDTLAVKLTTPAYDPTTGTLSFIATPLAQPKRALGPDLSSFDSRLDRTLPASFGAVSLFIDDTSAPVNADGQLGTGVGEYWVNAGVTFGVGKGVGVSIKYKSGYCVNGASNESFTTSQASERHKFSLLASQSFPICMQAPSLGFWDVTLTNLVPGKVITTGLKLLQLGIGGKYAAGCSLTPGLQCKQNGLEVEITK
jgi:hypothetical protein